MKEYKVISYIKKDGKYVRFDSLEKEEREEIADRLNKRALKAAGYVPVTEKNIN